MKVQIIKETFLDEWRNGLWILIDGKTVFSAHDGEPEDNTLGRNFNDCWSIPKLLKLAYEAGKAGEEFIVESKEENYAQGCDEE